MGLYYDRIASIYDATRPLPQSVSEQVTDCILRIVKAKPETKFLEPGIGTGRTALPIIQRGYSYTGVDISNEMMDQLRHKLRGVPDNLTLLQADATSLPFENDSFDVVLTVHVLQLIPDRLKALSEIRRVLKPFGFFLHCDNPMTPHQKDFDRQWQAILAQHQPGFEMKITKPLPGQKGVMQVLIEQGAAIETVIAAQWRVEQTVGELLDTYQTRPFGSCWEVSEDVFFQAMRDLRDWCLKHYESLDVIHSSDATFNITVIRDWASV